MAWNEESENSLKLWMSYQYQLARKAAKDERFRDALVRNPAAALHDLGVEVPPGVKITVLEPTAENIYVVLPPPPGGVSYRNFDVSDADLISSASAALLKPWDDFDIRRKKDAWVGNRDSNDPGQKNSDMLGDEHNKDG